MSLLLDRIIDASVTTDRHDLPESPDYEAIHLWDWPGQLVADISHPLVHESRLTRADIGRFPSLVLPANLYPGLASAMHAKGFGRQRRLYRYDIGSWEGLTEDAVTISYRTCISRATNPKLCAIDWGLGRTGGESLILLREWSEHSAIARLIDDFRLRQKSLQSIHPELVGRL